MTLLRSYMGMRDHVKSHPAARALLEAAYADRMAGATVFRGDIGLGRSRMVRTYMSEVQLDSLPLLVQVADTRERIESFIDQRADLFSGHLTTLESIWVVHASGQVSPALLEQLPDGRSQRLLRVFFGAKLEVAGVSFANAVSSRLGTGILATMVLTATEGFGSHRRIHRGSLFHPGRELPVMLSIMCDGVASADEALSVVLELSGDVTVTTESVSVSRCGH